MGLFSKFFSGLQKTQNNLSSELKRIISRSPKLTDDDVEDLEAVLLSSDMGFTVTEQIIEGVRKEYESSSGQTGNILEIAKSIVEKNLSHTDNNLIKNDNDLTVISLVGVNGAGKTTTAGKLAHYIKDSGKSPNACSLRHISRCRNRTT